MKNMLFTSQYRHFALAKVPFLHCQSAPFGALKVVALLVAVFSVCTDAFGLELKPVKRDFNYFYKTAQYEEDKIPQYVLPDPLVMEDGHRVSTAEEWETTRRPQLIKMLTTYMYGRAPQLAHALPWSVDTLETKALKGEAIRKVVTLRLSDNPQAPVMHLQVYLPRKAQGKVPLFLGLSFCDNSKIATAPEWQLHDILSHGYGLATFRYTEVCPDKALRAYSEGLMPYYYRKGQVRPDPDEWGSIALWAWCASRAMDYLQTDAQIDASKVALFGHSRLAKTALWAGATDRRFAMVVLINAGCCGTALSRRMIGETPTSINHVMPAWFDDNFKQFSDRENCMPFDQHTVISLIAPRPVYVASAQDDKWGDPKGEFLGAKGAENVYALYGEKGIGTDSLPPVNQPFNKGYIGYHIRSGKHAVLPYDWKQVLSFADRFFR